MCEIAETDLHWLAGLLEGEASFHLCKERSGRQVYPVIKLKMCDRDVVERAAALMGRTKDLLEVAPLSPKHKTQYVAHIIGSRAVPWLHRLRPLMGQRRQQQIDNVLAGMTAIDTSLRKLDAVKVQEIRALWKEGILTQGEIGALYGVHSTTVCMIVNGRAWRNVPSTSESQ